MKISVIIPTLNEAEQITNVVQSTRNLGDCEIIVVDGGSDDATVMRASEADRVITTSAGRAIQQNMGAQASSGDLLLFLHADCRLPADAFDSICQILRDESIVGGCFSQQIDHPGWRYRWIEFGNALRVRCLEWAYGDQAIFVRRVVFEELEGFPDLPLMEDLYFMKRLKRKGRFRLLEDRLTVSARRWEKCGIFRQTLRNWKLIVLAHCGVPMQKLANQYRHVRESD